MQPVIGANRPTSSGVSISFRPVELERDLELLHRWQHEPHVVPYWQLAIPLEAYREHLIQFLSMPHQTLLIGEVNGEPVSYFESYWAASDRLAAYYDAEAGDQGMHLLIGPPEQLGRGLSRPLVLELMRQQLLEPSTRRFVVEPDMRNARMRHVFERCGFRFDREVQLPEKRAALMFCERERFEELTAGRTRLEEGEQHGE
ncbi:GNAT family N-acetyltransferase [Paenibacillus sp. YYML68]|uniref:GNAT family N-acetyltransferase n=1 Tax=Paenibacillus sp. YYML68 TaxID=2909250 RepID=UPI002492FE10|nr:GNAT family N-acetyltransferase [Paenibacillus sp. YYML68]